MDKCLLKSSYFGMLNLETFSDNVTRQIREGEHLNSKQLQSFD